MTIDPWLAWLTFGISAAIFFLATGIASAFGSGPIGWARAGNGNDASDDLDSLPPDVARLNFAGIASGSRALAMAAAVAAALSLAYALESASFSFAGALVIAGVSLAAGMLLVSVGVTRIELARSSLVRAALLPVGKGIHLALGVPGIEYIVSSPRTQDSDDASWDDAALDDSLSLLEAAGISPDPGELEMIRAVLRLDRARVREIMQPRVDMVAAASSVGFDELAASMTDAGHSRIPIYDDTIDQIVGVVHSQDMLRAHTRRDPDGELPTMKELARPTLFVPEAQMLDQLLREFQRARTQIAIVIDEYGGVAGLVTVQDLIEEIVGELVDEFDTDEPEMQRISDQELRMDARMPLDVLRQELGVDIHDVEGFDTVGGLVYRELGKMPTPGDQVAIDGIRLTVESTMGRRIRQVRVRRVGSRSEPASS